MINNFYQMGLLGSLSACMVAFFIGLAFGAILEMAGFASSKKLSGVFYLKDLTVIKVMFSAILTAIIGLVLLDKLGVIEISKLFHLPTYYGGAMVGGLIFGVGFVMGGYCPGTAGVGLVSGRIDALIFIIGSGIGVFIFNLGYGFFQKVNQWGGREEVTLWQTLHMSQERLIWIILIIGIVVLLLSEMWNGATYSLEVKNLFRNRPLIVFLLSLILINFVLSSMSEKVYNRDQIIAREIVDGEDHISSAELFKLMGNPPEEVLLIDIRERAEYDKYHLPRAVNVELPALFTYLSGYKANQKIILYSNGMTHSAQAWVLLRVNNFNNVYFLTDGLSGYINNHYKPDSLK